MIGTIARHLAFFLAAFLGIWLASVVVGCTTSAIKPEPTVLPSPSPSWVAAPAVGFTLESVEDLPAIAKVLDALPQKPWVRIVLQQDRGKWVPLSEYVAAVQVIGPKANILLELVDSDFDLSCDLACYESRAREVITRFKGKVKAVEGINEANGTGKNWLSADTVEKFSTVARIMKAAGMPVWLTLYSEDPETYQAWINRLPADVLTMVDYVTLSEYPKDNSGHQTDLNEFARIVGQKFPNALIGFGECPSLECLKRKVDHPRWIGLGMDWFGSDEIESNPREFTAGIIRGMQ